jgi:hypothetical protein
MKKQHQPAGRSFIEMQNAAAASRPEPGTPGDPLSINLQLAKLRYQVRTGLSRDVIVSELIRIGEELREKTA